MGEPGRGDRECRRGRLAHHRRGHAEHLGSQVRTSGRRLPSWPIYNAPGTTNPGRQHTLRHRSGGVHRGLRPQRCLQAQRCAVTDLCRAAGLLPAHHGVAHHRPGHRRRRAVRYRQDNAAQEGAGTGRAITGTGPDAQRPQTSRPPGNRAAPGAPCRHGCRRRLPPAARGAAGEAA